MHAIQYDGKKRLSALVLFLSCGLKSSYLYFLMPPFLNARNQLYLQDLARRDIIKVIKVATEDNTADILTKVLPRKQFLVLRYNLLNLGKRPSTILGPLLRGTVPRLVHT